MKFGLIAVVRYDRGRLAKTTQWKRQPDRHHGMIAKPTLTPTQNTFNILVTQGGPDALLFIIP